MSKPVLCQYIIQNDEVKIKGKKQLFNAFVIPKKDSNELRVLDVKKAVPFNEAEYHFRFQTRMGNMKVWVDTSKDSVAVPNIEGVIKIKLLRFPKGVSGKQPVAPPVGNQSAQDPIFNKSASNNLHELHNDNVSASKGKPIHHSNSQNNIAGDAEMSKKNSHKTHSQQDHDEELIGGFDDHDHHSQNNAHQEMNFDINTDEIFGVHEKRPEAAPQHEDHGNLLGDFETNNNTLNQTPPPSQAQNFDLGGDLGDLGGVDFTVTEKPAKEEVKEPESLIAHVNKIHSTSETEKEEWQKAYQKHDHRIRIWKGEPHQNSIKILLCTLHDVLWEGAKWNRMGMHELQDPNSVKKAYRKAILITHPDRVNKSPTEQKFLANRVFGTLNEAWKIFEQTGQ